MQALDLARELISFDSVSRKTNVPVTEFVERTLRTLGFETERIDYVDDHGVPKANVVGRKGRPGPGGFAYFGHTDVVPADPWFDPEGSPFRPVVRDGRLVGRGSCDMKGSVACALAASSRIPAERLQAPVYVTCTADEEIGYGGATEVAARSELYRQMVAGDARGIIGEPTELEVVHAHKGTYGIRAVSKGKAAHSSTREGINANLRMIPFLAEMKRMHDELLNDESTHDPRFDPPWVSWNIGINDHTAAPNITPPQSVCTVYFRPTPKVDAEALVARARRAAEECGIEFVLVVSGSPLYVDPESPLVRECLAIADRPSSRTVSYGTDGVKFSALPQRVVFGPGSIAQAHTWDEWIALDQLELGTDAYTRCIERWCC